MSRFSSVRERKYKRGLDRDNGSVQSLHQVRHALPMSPRGWGQWEFSPPLPMFRSMSRRVWGHCSQESVLSTALLNPWNIALREARRHCDRSKRETSKAEGARRPSLCSQNQPDHYQKFRREVRRRDSDGSKGVPGDGKVESLDSQLECNIFRFHPKKRRELETGPPRVLAGQ